MKKKPAHALAAEAKPDMRTAADYEKLRYLMVEGGEIQDKDERELTVFMVYGVAAWIRFEQESHVARQTKWAKPFQRCFAGNLAVLLANMMES